MLHYLSSRFTSRGKDSFHRWKVIVPVLVQLLSIEWNDGFPSKGNDVPPPRQESHRSTEPAHVGRTAKTGQAERRTRRPMVIPSAFGSIALPRSEVSPSSTHYRYTSSDSAEAIICCAKRAEAGICAGGVPCSLIWKAGCIVSTIRWRWGR